MRQFVDQASSANGFGQKNWLEKLMQREHFALTHYAEYRQNIFLLRIELKGMFNTIESDFTICARQISWTSDKDK